MDKTVDNGELFVLQSDETNPDYRGLRAGVPIASEALEVSLVWLNEETLQRFTSFSTFSLFCLETKK